VQSLGRGLELLVVEHAKGRTPQKPRLLILVLLEVENDAADSAFIERHTLEMLKITILEITLVIFSACSLIRSES